MLRRKKYKLQLRSGTLVLGERTLVMGVLNVTPDSFSDGGKFLDVRDAVKQALAMEKAGADLIDIGAESTRPGSQETTAAEELRRLLPVLEALHGRMKIPISVDTRKAAVAEAALKAGAQIINDVSGLRHDAALAGVAAKYQAPLILMHMRGEPRTMQKTAFASDVLKDVLRGLRHSLEIARRAGVKKSQIILDPGIGFGKSFAQNYELLRKLPAARQAWLSAAGGHVAERFSWQDIIARRQSRAPGRAYLGDRRDGDREYLGGAHIVRVHDVEEMVKVAKVADCVLGGNKMRI